MPAMVMPGTVTAGLPQERATMLMPTMLMPGTIAAGLPQDLQTRAEDADLDPEGLHLLLQVIKGHTTDAAHRPSESRVHNIIPKPIDLKDLGTMVAGQQADSHLGQDLEHTLLQGSLVVPLGVLHADVC